MLISYTSDARICIRNAVNYVKIIEHMTSAISEQMTSTH